MKLNEKLKRFFKNDKFINLIIFLSSMGIITLFSYLEDSNKSRTIMSEEEFRIQDEIEKSEEIDTFVDGFIIYKMINENQAVCNLKTDPIGGNYKTPNGWKVVSAMKINNGYIIFIEKER